MKGNKELITVLNLLQTDKLKIISQLANNKKKGK